MRQADYSPQEPLSEAGTAYGNECWRRSAGIVGTEHAFGTDEYQRLLVFEANKPDGRILLFWHGGGWTSGYKEWMGFMAPAFTAAGVTFVSAGYRLAPQHLFPDALDDCIDAIKWVAANIDRYGGDAGKIFIGGHSAGGHYAALLAANAAWTRSAGLARNAVRGCMPLSGVFEFGEASGLSVRPRFLGTDPANEKRASPRWNLDPLLPPFLVAHGTHDFPHLIAQAGRFVQAVREQSGEAQHLEMSERTHFTSSYAGGETDGPWVNEALAFMARHAGS